MAGIAGLDHGAGADRRPGRMQIRLAQPRGRGGFVDRLHRPEHDIGAGGVQCADQRREPAGAGRFIVIDEGGQRRIGVREAGVAGDRNIARRRMQIKKRQAQILARARDQVARAGRIVIVHNNNAHCQPGWQYLRSNRLQCCRQGWPPIRADTDIYAGRSCH